MTRRSMNYRICSPLIAVIHNEKSHYKYQNMEYLEQHLSGFAQMQNEEYLVLQAELRTALPQPEGIHTFH